MKKRKLFDEQGRIFGVISVVDVLAVVVAAVLGLMLYMRYFSGGDANPDAPSVSGSANATVECELLVSGLRSFGVDSIEVGDDLYSPDTGAILGRVTEKRTEPFTQLTNTLDGRVVEMPVEGLFDLYLTVECPGTVADGRCYLKGTSELMKNMSVGFETRYVYTAGSLVSFTYEVTK